MILAKTLYSQTPNRFSCKPLDILSLFPWNFFEWSRISRWINQSLLGFCDCKICGSAKYYCFYWLYDFMLCRSLHIENLLCCSIWMMVGRLYTIGIDRPWYMWKCHYWVREGKPLCFFSFNDYEFVILCYCALQFSDWVVRCVLSMLLLCFNADSCICTSHFREVVVPSKTHACNKGPHSYANQRVGSPVSVLIMFVDFSPPRPLSMLFLNHVYDVKAFQMFSCAQTKVACRYQSVLWMFFSVIWLYMLCAY